MGVGFGPGLPVGWLMSPVWAIPDTARAWASRVWGTRLIEARGVSSEGWDKRRLQVVRIQTRRNPPGRGRCEPGSRWLDRHQRPEGGGRQRGLVAWAWDPAGQS